MRSKKIPSSKPAPAPESAPQAGGQLPDPEVPAKSSRRTFTAEYKLRILREADSCTEQGELGALLRREGLYSSHLATWRRNREQSALVNMSARRRGKQPRRRDPLAEENERLRRQVTALEGKLLQAHTIIDIQKKVSQLLGVETSHSQERS